MKHSRIVAVVLTGVLIGATLVTSQAWGDEAGRTEILSDLTAISCDVLTHEHDPDDLRRADVMLRSVVRDVAGPGVLTPSAFQRTSDSLVLALAAEVRERFGEPSDQITRVNAARTEAVIGLLVAGRTGLDMTEEAWLFGPMPDRTVEEGSMFEVPLGVCPGTEPSDGTTLVVRAADSSVLASSAFVLRGDTLQVRTARRPGGDPLHTTVTIVATTAAGLTSIAEFDVTLRHTVQPAVPSPPPATTQAPTTTAVATTLPAETTSPPPVTTQAPPAAKAPTDAPAPPAVTTTTTTSPTTTSSTTTVAPTTTTSPTTTSAPTSSTTEPPTTTTSTTTTTTTTSPTTTSPTTTTTSTTVPPAGGSSEPSASPQPVAMAAFATDARRRLGRSRVDGRTTNG